MFKTAQLDALRKELARHQPENYRARYAEHIEKIKREVRREHAKGFQKHVSNSCARGAKVQ